MKVANKFESSKAMTILKSNYLTYSLHCILGSLFLGLMAQFSLNLPFTPIPITMQTLALFLLVIGQGRSKATGSVVLYLTQATFGLPVLHMGIPNSLWMISPTGGYLIAFVVFTFVVGTLLEKRNSPGILWTAFSLTLGNCILFLIGAFQLGFFVGFNNAFEMGIAPFIIGAVIKIICACCASVPINSTLLYFESMKSKYS